MNRPVINPLAVAGWAIAAAFVLCWALMMAMIVETATCGPVTDRLTEGRAE